MKVKNLVNMKSHQKKIIVLNYKIIYIIKYLMNNKLLNIKLWILNKWKILNYINA